MIRVSRIAKRLSTREALRCATCGREVYVVPSGNQPAVYHCVDGTDACIPIAELAQR